MENPELKLSKLITFYQGFYNIPRSSTATKRAINDLQRILSHQLERETQGGATYPKEPGTQKAIQSLAHGNLFPEDPNG